MQSKTWISSILLEKSADPIDLLDGVAVKLEQARSVTWAVSEQIERSTINFDELTHNLCGEVGTLYTQLVEAQELVERLFAALAPRALQPEPGLF